MTWLVPLFLPSFLKPRHLVFLEYFFFWRFFARKLCAAFSFLLRTWSAASTALANRRRSSHVGGGGWRRRRRGLICIRVSKRDIRRQPFCGAGIPPPPTHPTTHPPPPNLLPFPNPARRGHGTAILEEDEDEEEDDDEEEEEEWKRMKRGRKASNVSREIKRKRGVGRLVVGLSFDLGEEMARKSTPLQLKLGKTR